VDAFFAGGFAASRVHRQSQLEGSDSVDLGIPGASNLRLFEGKQPKILLVDPTAVKRAAD
jgi:hypothetical protein